MVGITIAMVNMKAVFSHWPTVAAMFRSCMMIGKATPNKVSFRKTTKVLINRIAMISTLAGASFCDLDKGVITFDLGYAVLLVLTNKSYCAPIDTLGAVHVC